MEKQDPTSLCAMLKWLGFLISNCTHSVRFRARLAVIELEPRFDHSVWMGKTSRVIQNS